MATHPHQAHGWTYDCMPIQEQQEYVDALLDSMRGAEYEVRFTNGVPAEGSSLVCIDDPSGQISAKSVLTFSYTPLNRPAMHHASGNGWSHNFLDNFPILSIFSTSKHSKICLTSAPVTTIWYGTSYFKVYLSGWCAHADQIKNFGHYLFNIPGFL